ncbi:MAG: hypothetical protein AAF892_12490 [Cyanobacteria bacterium P01_D01_bin.71]
MASRLTAKISGALRRAHYETGALRPAHRETVFCKTLVVGNSIAAYTATLAILQAGGQVCWAQTGTRDLVKTLNRQQAQPAKSRFSWRHGRQILPWEDATIMSQSQQSFWTNWPSPSALSPTQAPASETALSPLSPSSPTAVSAREAKFRQAIAPHLRSQQLMLVRQGRPIRVLYSQQRERRRVHQVVFQDMATQQQFQIHARLVLDATADAVLQKDLADAAESTLIPEHRLTVEETMAAFQHEARGPFFTDSIAVILMLNRDRLAKPRPLSVPLRSLILQNTEGFLSVSLPGCEPQLRSIFQHPTAQWTLGEAAGQVAAKAAQLGSIAALRSQPNWQWTLQQILVRQGIPVFACDDVALNDPDFEAIQMVALADVVRTARRRDLGFYPETPVTKAVLASALARLPQPALPATAAAAPPLSDVSAYHWAEQAIRTAIAQQTIPPEDVQTFAPSKVISKRFLWQVVQPLYPDHIATPLFTADETPACRRHLSRLLYPILNSRLSC